METQEKVRDLSARYGSGKQTQRHPDDVIPPIGFKHPLFLLIASLGFATLHTELIFFASTYYTKTFDPIILAGVFVVSFGLMYTSYLLPHRMYRSRFKNYSPIVFLATQWTVSILMMLAMSLITFGAGVFVVEGRLDAIAEILRSLTLYTIAAILIFHGLVIYVRYVRFLYEREMHESYKIVSFAGVSALLVLVVTLYLLQFDLGRMGGTLPDVGWLSLHLTIRDVILLGMTIFVFAWHGTVLADH